MNGHVPRSEHARDLTAWSTTAGTRRWVNRLTLELPRHAAFWENEQRPLCRTNWFRAEPNRANTTCTRRTARNALASSIATSYAKPTCSLLLRPNVGLKRRAEGTSA